MYIHIKLTYTLFYIVIRSFSKNIFEAIDALSKEQKMTIYCQEGTALAFIFDVTNRYLITRIKEI